jgi:hypothetical protein
MPEAMLPAPGLSQTVPHVLETIDGEDMDTVGHTPRVLMQGRKKTDF